LVLCRNCIPFNARYFTIYWNMSFWRNASTTLREDCFLIGWNLWWKFAIVSHLQTINIETIKDWINTLFEDSHSTPTIRESEMDIAILWKSVEHRDSDIDDERFYL
jgi:hypothetical protein